MKPIQPKTIAITGCTRGLGKALTERLIHLGHTVFGCGRNAMHIQNLQSRYSTPHQFRVVDVVNLNSVEEWFKSIYIELNGPPDIIVNNAAVMNRPSPLWEIEAPEFDRLVDINIKGVANVIRAFVPSMVARSEGIIVNLSSGWGRSTSPEVAPYCASKYAIEGLTLSLAQELPPGMAAIPLNPGVIDTDMLRECFGSAASSYPGPTEWAEKAAPFILQFAEKDNGRSLTVPL